MDGLELTATIKAALDNGHGVEVTHVRITGRGKRGPGLATIRRPVLADEHREVDNVVAFPARRVG